MELNILERIEQLMEQGISEDEASRIVNFENGGDYNE